jgi:exosome complex exonuclease RRP6
VPRNLDIPKPQKLFEHVPKNDEKGPFKPLMTVKPHAVVPLEQSMRLEAKNTQTDEPDFIHPYVREIDEYSYPAFVYSQDEPIPYTPFENTTATYVDTEEALEEMIAELKQAKEIAVDLEHHDYRTYIGLVSLMQISTRNRDWIIDTLKPWRRRLQRLNEVFADPKILKVFHGATSDIIWLQRDLGIYVVGLFDTFHGCRALRYPGASLAFLLLKFCNFEAQKQYQMADWRIRPIPQQLLDYARSDTHFLLYIYDCMRNDLLASSTQDEDLMNIVLTNSKTTSLQRYEHPIYDTIRGMGPVGWYRLIGRTPAIYNREQFAVFRAVHAWRDRVARQEDESTTYIMNNHILFAVARELPVDKTAMFRVVSPMSQPVRLRIDELVGLIFQARQDAEHEREMWDVMAEIDKLLLSKKAEKYAAQEALSSNNSAQTTGGSRNVVTPILSKGSSMDAIPTPNRPAQPLQLSKFWGNIANSPRTQYHTSRIILKIPLPDLTAEIFATTDAPAETPTKTGHDFVPADERVMEDGTDDIFIVKQLGGNKRKRGSDRPEIESLDHIAVQDDKYTRQQEEKARQKEEKKRKRKEERRLAKEAAEKQQTSLEEQQSLEDDLIDEEIPDVNGRDEDEEFDYAAAPNVLGVPPEEVDRRKKMKGKKGAFDVYSRALDAPKGLPRNQKESAGKSATFRK